MVRGRKKKRPGWPPGMKKSEDQPEKRDRKPRDVRIENGGDGVQKVETFDGLSDEKPGLGVFDDGVLEQKEEVTNLLKKSQDQPKKRGRKPRDVKLENGGDGVQKVENFDGLSDEKPSLGAFDDGVLEKKEEVTNLFKNRLREGRRKVYYDEDQVFPGLFKDDFNKKKKRRRGERKQLTPENGNGEEMKTGEVRRSMKPKMDAAIQMETKKRNKETEDSNMCHQCQRNDRGRVVNCKSGLGRKRFCIPCITTWYHIITSCSINF